MALASERKFFSLSRMTPKFFDDLFDGILKLEKLTILSIDLQGFVENKELGEKNLNCLIDNLKLVHKLQKVSVNIKG